MQSTPVLNRAGRRRSPATLSRFHRDRTPPNKGAGYPPDPPGISRPDEAVSSGSRNTDTGLSG